MSTTLEHYTLPIPAHQRAVVEKLSRLVTDGDELDQFEEDLAQPLQQIQWFLANRFQPPEIST